MRALIAALLLGLLGPEAARAQFQGAREVQMMVNDFNKKATAALEEYHRSGNFRRYQRAIEPLLNYELMAIRERLQGSLKNPPGS